MNKQLEVASWDSDTAFEVGARKTGSGLKRFSEACLNKLQSLKKKISSELAFRFENVRPQIFRQAMNEAEALAVDTTFPSLFLPVLAEEKVFLASQWERKQREVQERSWLLAA